MQYLVIVLSIITAFLLYPPPPTGTHLFILSGQSNMSRLDPNISFTPRIEKAFGKKHIVIVKDAADGQPIHRWYKNWTAINGETSAVNGDLYDRLINKINAAISTQNIKSVSFIWMQGETDAAMRHGDVYRRSLQGLIDQLRADLGHDDIHVVIGRISDTHMKPSKYSHWLTVREAQVRFAESSPNITWVNTDDLNDGMSSQGYILKNGLHYSIEGYEILGQRFADAAINLIQQSVAKKE